MLVRKNSWINTRYKSKSVLFQNPVIKEEQVTVLKANVCRILLRACIVRTS